MKAIEIYYIVTYFFFLFYLHMWLESLVFLILTYMHHVVLGEVVPDHQLKGCPLQHIFIYKKKHALTLSDRDALGFLDKEQVV